MSPAERGEGARSGGAAVAAAALAVVVIGLAVASGLLFARVRAIAATQAARARSVAAAQREVPELLSYSYLSFGADLARAESVATGRFRATYRELMSTKVEPAALAQHVVTRTTVSGVSVISARPGAATLLMFLSEQTRKDTRAETVLNDAAVRVEMLEVAGAWRVAGLTPRS